MNKPMSQERTSAIDDSDGSDVSLAQRLVDTLPTFSVTGAGKNRCVTATVRYECGDLESFAKTRADQLVQLIDMADYCDSQFEPVLRGVTYDIAREVAGLVHALTRNEVRHEHE